MMVMKTFVIAPPDMTERRRLCEERFSKCPVNPEFFNGLTGDVTGIASTKDDPAKPYSRLPPGKVALALNHWCLWQHIAMSNIQMSLIFEDDVMIPEGFWRNFHERLGRTPADWEIVYLGITFPERLEDKRIRAEKLDGGVWRHQGMNAFDGTVDGTWAYMLSLSGAKKLAGVRFELDEPIDRWLTFRALTGLKTYIWHPSVINHVPHGV